MRLSFIVVSGMITTFLTTIRSDAQTFEHAGQYMDYISSANQDLTVMFLSYTSAVSHGKSARKVEKRRQEVVDAIYYTRNKIAGMGSWKGDKAYKDTTVSYLKLLDIVFREDYGKIVNMEEIAEQSYDAMEAFMLAREKADEKLDQALEKQREASKAFASKYNVNLIEGENDISLKSKAAAAVNKHHNDLYLVFFKPYKQESYLLLASEKGDLVALEQAVNALDKFAKEGMEKLKGMKGYNGDGSLIEATRHALQFYQSEATRAKSFSDFYLKKEKFEKAKKTFDSMKKSERKPADIDNFNFAVDEFNYAVNKFNDVNNQLNKERTDMINNWNKKASKFLDDHTPVQKRVKMQQ